MDFCPECGKRLTPEKKGDTAVLVCRRCGYEKKPEERLKIVRKSPQRPSQEVVVVEKETRDSHLPKITGVECPSCGNAEAVYWVVQTRSMDEGSTQFYRCTKCGHTWREYG